MALADKFFNVINSKYSKTDIVDLATSFLKRSLNPGEAVVNVLGNTGIAGFKFHIPESEQVILESDITDYYTDSNSVLQDHIARKPIRVTSSGLVGEYFYSIHKIEDMLAKVTPTMSLVKQFMPKFTNGEIQIIQKREVQKISAVVSAVSENGSTVLKGNFSTTSTALTFNGLNLFKLFQELYKLKSAQTRAYFFFEAMWKSQAPFSIETRWKRFDNMVVQNIKVLGEKTADNTEFMATFKQINFAQSQKETLEKAAGRTAAQLMKRVNKGVDKGEEVPTV